MSLLSIDLGGTKLAVGIFDKNGSLLNAVLHSDHAPIEAIGVSVPGISNSKNGTVWAPNIPGWENYSLLSEIQSTVGDIPVCVESDRSCYILGEMWQGNARGREMHEALITLSYLQ
jgi:glucokinase